MAANFNISDLKNFTFKKFPTALYSEPKYYDLSDSAKILYAYAYDKMGLSFENGFIDDAGDVYIYYTLQSIIEEFHWSRDKAKRALKALEEFELIEQKREGAGLSYRIYVKKLITSEESANNKASDGVGLKRAQGGLKTSPGVGSKQAHNETNNIYTEYIDINACTRVTQKSPKSKNSFMNFEQRKYDMHQLEQALLNQKAGDSS